MRETNLEEFQFYDFLSQDFPLLQIVLNSCLDRPARLRKLNLSCITLLIDRIKDIETQNLYLDSLKELELLFLESPENPNLANEELKNLVHILSCFKNLEALSFVFYDPVPNSFFLYLIPLFNSCPLRRFSVIFDNGISDFNQSALESLVICSLGIKTFEHLKIDIRTEDEQLDGLVPINIEHFQRFNSQLKRRQMLSISVSDGTIKHIYESGKKRLAELTKHY